MTNKQTIWEYKQLSSLGSFSKGVGISKADIVPQGAPCIRYAEIYTKYNFQLSQCLSHIPTEIAQKSTPIAYGNILFAGSGETAEDIGKSVAYLGKDTAYASGDIIIFTLKDKKENALFFSYYLNTAGRQQLNKLGEGQSVVHIYPEELSKVFVPHPLVEEQHRIVEVLETWDKAIQLTRKLIEQKELQKKYLMQQLLTGRTRLKGFTGKWKKVHLENMLYEVDKRTTCNNQYQIMSVTKNGIYSQQEYFDKQIASENNIGYKILRRSNIVFSPMNLWMGSIGFFQKDIGIVSPAYKIFSINPKIALFDFLRYFMTTPKMLYLYKINSEMGASIVRRNLDINGLLSSDVFIPSIKEQYAIAKVISTSDKQVDLLKQKLVKLEEQKKGLMQILLTGKVRLNW